MEPKTKGIVFTAAGVGLLIGAGFGIKYLLGKSKEKKRAEEAVGGRGGTPIVGMVKPGVNQSTVGKTKPGAN